MASRATKVTVTRSTAVSIVVTNGLHSAGTVAVLSAAHSFPTATHTPHPSSYSQNNPYLYI